MFNVIVAQTAVYNGERTAVTIRTQQMVSRVNFMMALTAVGHFATDDA